MSRWTLATAGAIAVAAALLTVAVTADEPSAPPTVAPRIGPRDEDTFAPASADHPYLPPPAETIPGPGPGVIGPGPGVIGPWPGQIVPVPLRFAAPPTIAPESGWAPPSAQYYAAGPQMAPAPQMAAVPTYIPSQLPGNFAPAGAPRIAYPAPMFAPAMPIGPAYPLIASDLAPCAPAPMNCVPGGSLQAHNLRVARLHLEMAGERSLCEELDKRIAKEEIIERLRQLEATKSQVARLEKEIEHLGQITGAPKQVLVKVKLVDVKIGQIRKRGVDVHLTPGQDKRSAALSSWINPKSASETAIDSCPGGATVEQESAVSAWLEGLKKEKLATIVAAPNLVANNGQEAHFVSGAEQTAPANAGDDPRAAKPDFVGTRLDVTPYAASADQVRVEYRLQVSELAPQQSAKNAVPNVHAFQTCSTIEVAEGQTAITCVALPAGAATVNQGIEQEVLRLVLVTPSVVSPVPPPDAVAGEAKQASAAAVLPARPKARAPQATPRR